MIVDGANDQAVLVGVQDDNEYQISLSALYGDGAQSEAVAIRYSTSELSVCTFHTPVLLVKQSCMIFYYIS